MTFDDTNNEFAEAVEAGSDARLCPYCKERPLLERKNAKTCGAPECKTTHGNSHGRPLLTKQCVICDTDFTTRNSQQILCGAPECAKQRMQANASARAQTEDGKRILQAAQDAYYLRKRGGIPLDWFRSCVVCMSAFKPVSDRQVLCGDEECKKARQSKLMKEKMTEPGAKERQQEYQTRYRAKRGMLPPSDPRTCPYCSTEFMPRTRRQITCAGQECKRKHHAVLNTKRLQTVKGKTAQRAKERPWSRGHGGPKTAWEAQNRRSAYIPSLFDNHGWDAVGEYMETDHLVPVKLLNEIGITDPRAVNCDDRNLRIIPADMNGSKSCHPLHAWLKKQKRPAREVRAGKALYERTVNLIVAKQQEIDPAYRLTPERREILGLD